MILLKFKVQLLLFETYFLLKMSKLKNGREKNLSDHQTMFILATCDYVLSRRFWDKRI